MTRHRLGLGEEREPPGEDAARQEIARLLERQYARSNPPGRGVALRDQHAKAHGCVRATFTVTDDVPAPLRHGLFAQPATYTAWVRFSASSPRPRPDTGFDAHGMAIKVLDVTGDGDGSTTQDLVLVNSTVFFCRNAADYVDVTAAVARGRLPAFFFPSWRPWRWRVPELVNLVNAIRHRIHDPLDVRYWSQTPYKLGPHAVKYAARPSGGPSRRRARGPDRLREAMVAHLAAGPASFDVLVQRQVDAARMPVEDPTVVWSERRSPFVKVATCDIPPQSFDTEERRRFAEHLSFTPWHALPEHRPLGGINRVRRPAYGTISRLRHEINGVVEQEPRSVDGSGS